MAESVQNTDVEDVLSSIRRLVAEASNKAGSDDGTPAQDIADDAVEALENAALLLTSSQRVSKDDTLEGPDDTAENAFADDLAQDDGAETADLGELRQALKRKAEEALEEADSHTGDADEAGTDGQPMFSKLPKSRLHLSDAMAKSPGSDDINAGPLDPVEVFTPHVDISGEDVAHDGDAAEADDAWKVALPEDYYEDEVDADDAEADVWIVDTDASAEDSATTAQIYDFDADRDGDIGDEADTDSDGAFSTSLADVAETVDDPVEDAELDTEAAVADVLEDTAEDLEESSDLMIVRPEVVPDDDALPATSDADAIHAAAIADDADAQKDHAEDQSSEGEAAALNMSSDELTALVRDVVRQELTGEMGTLITKNLRQLVRREINRVLATKEFD